MTTRVQISKKQKEFLQSDAKNVVFVGGVGSGKSLIAAEKTIQLLLKGAYVLTLAATYKQLKLVLFQLIQDRLNLHKIPFTLNKSDMVIDIPLTGGRVYGYSSESIENVRGVTVDVAIFDEAALMSLYDFQLAYARLRRGKVPLQTFIATTPRGIDNWVYNLCQEPETHFIRQRTDENPFLPNEYIQELKKQYDGELLEQELNGDFISGSNELQFIPMDHYLNALDRKTIKDSNDLKIGGLDVARYGKDSSVLVERQGNSINNVKKWLNIDTVQLTGEVVNYVIENQLDYLVVDSVGLGAGVFDQLNDKLKNVCKVIEFNGGYKPQDDKKYLNKRAEAYGRLKEWLKEGGCISKDFGDLTSIRFELNNKGQIKLESKEILKLRTGKSPDLEDALSMTFAVDAKKQRVRRERSKQATRFQRLVFSG